MGNEKQNPQMDWQQVVLNGGPPCFALAGDLDSHYCGRAQRWAGHDSHHKFVSLDDLLATVRAEAFKEAAGIAQAMAVGETYETGRQKALNIAAALEAAATAAPPKSRSNHFPNEALNKGFPDHISRDGTAYYSDGTVLPPTAAPVEQSDEVTLRIPTCGKCPFVDHSGAFTPGGAKPICGHRDAPDTFAATITGDEHYHWKYRQVDLASAPPEQCPLRQPVTDDEGAR